MAYDASGTRTVNSSPAAQHIDSEEHLFVPERLPDYPHREGYLSKLNKDGKLWQRRYFYTNGQFLTYYKTDSMQRLLAAFNLPLVGEIKMITGSSEDGDARHMFSIKLKSRLYILKAEDANDAEAWVLQDIKELNHSRTNFIEESIQMPVADIEVRFFFTVALVGQYHHRHKFLG